MLTYWVFDFFDVGGGGGGGDVHILGVISKFDNFYGLFLKSTTCTCVL